MPSRQRPPQRRDAQSARRLTNQKSGFRRGRPSELRIRSGWGGSVRLVAIPGCRSWRRRNLTLGRPGFRCIGRFPSVGVHARVHELLITQVRR